MSRNRKNPGLTALRVEGGILPPEFLAVIAAQGAKYQSGSDYGLTKSLSIKDELARYWRIANDLYIAYVGRRERTDANPAKVGIDDWLVPFLKDVLGFDGLAPARTFMVGERTFPITHHAFGDAVPILLTTREYDLDRANPQFGEEGRRRAPHSLMQELLNASEGVLWGIVANGAKLRFLRDNPSLTRPAHIEADLDLIFTEQLYSDFAALWLLGHASRFKPLDDKPSNSVLDRWRSEAHKTGERALEHLREGVTEALRQLGNGFLQHSQNERLRAALSDGSLSAERYFQELLRLVYRLLFLFTAEERNLLHLPSATDEQRAIYTQGYSLSRLRDHALKRRHYDRHHDLWQGVMITFRALARGESALALPALGGLFAQEQCPNVEVAFVSNERLLEAIRALAYFRTETGLARVNYRDMGTEELGSVYESLLELHPSVDVNATPWTFGFVGEVLGEKTKGSERKLTGSYYTSAPLVNELIKSALEPVMAKAVKANLTDPRQALLDLKIVDPACGSGHFLLAAARRLAAEIARIEAGSDTPDETARQHALREVVQHCIYGVDRNPLAVELCRTALWIETIEPGKPLTFLDHHIQCGDSLVGVLDPKVMADGIPDEAYKELTGDDKEVCKALKKRNREAENRARHGDLFANEAAPRYQAASVSIDDMPEETLSDITSKRERWERLQRDPDFLREKRRADLFTAAFFMPKTRATAEIVPVTEHLLCLADGQTIRADVIAQTDAFVATHRFFHWHIAFLQIMQKGGFDVVLGNPPWETMSPDHKEFFATYDPNVRFMSPAGQKAAYARLLENPRIAKRWNEYCRDLYTSVHFIKTSRRYRLFAPGNLGKGDFNVYRMFVETALALTRKGRVAAQFVPEGLYNGANATAIRGELFDNFRLEKLVGLENTKGTWFPSIDTRTKFCLYVAWREGRTARFNASFRVNSFEKLADVSAGRMLSIPINLIAEFSPDARAVMEFAAQEDIDICTKMYARYPKFGEKTDGLPYRVYMREVDMGTDRRLFSDHQDGLPVFEGRMVDAYDYRAKGYVSGRGRSAEWVDLPFGKPGKGIQPQWRIHPANVPDKLIGRIDQYRIGFCDIASPTNSRSFIACVVPPRTICGHSVPTICFEPPDLRYLLLWLGLANSLAVDFLVRKKVSLHMSYTIVDALPFSKDFGSTPSAAEIVERVFRLCAVGNEMEGLRQTAVEANVIPASLLVEENLEHRARLMAEIDVLVARDVYSLTQREMLYILNPANVLGKDCGVETFKALMNSEIREHDKYRTQQLILEAWDRLEGGARVTPSFATGTRYPVDVSTLPDSAWARPMRDQRAETGVLLVAILKAMNNSPLSARQVRLAALFALEPRLLLPYLNEAEAATWRRLVGTEADALAQNTLSFAVRSDQAWGAAVRNLRANGQLVDDIRSGTWAPGDNLDKFPTAGWPDGRASMVLGVLRCHAIDAVVTALPADLRSWVDAAAA